MFKAGDEITLDGTSGEVLCGAADMLEPLLDATFQKLMSWAEDAADIGIRANADTPADAQTARNFDAQGIGLCRTEHMFFDPSRLTVMREMIFADTSEGRRAVLERLLPMQRDDFIQLFRIMQGQPVCIRLFDPPLHEFLPSTRTGQRDLAEQAGRRDDADLAGQHPVELERAAVGCPKSPRCRPARSSRPRSKPAAMATPWCPRS